MGDEEANAKEQFHEVRWFFSILDDVAILTESPQLSRHWTELKQRTMGEDSFNFSHGSNI